MKRLLPAVAILALLLLATAPADAQELWGGARAGMHVQQIQQIFSKAQRRASSSDVKDGLELDGLTIQGEPYKAVFLLENERLVKVSLVHTATAGRDFEDALSEVYKPILAALRTKYGQEKTNHKDRTQFMREERHNWITGDRKIESKLVSFLGKIFITIDYKPAATGDLDKL